MTERPGPVFGAALEPGHDAVAGDHLGGGHGDIGRALVPAPER